MAEFKIPKPEQVRMSPETKRALAEFRRAAGRASETVGARAAAAMREFGAACERARKIRTP